MNQIVKKSLSFLTSAERKIFILLLLGRTLASALDFVGVISIGFLTTSVALFLTQGSNPARVLRIAGINFPAVNIHILPIAVGLILSLFVAKAILSILFTKSLVGHLAKVESRAARVVVEAMVGQDLSTTTSKSRDEIQQIATSGVSSAFTGILNNVATLVSEGFLFFGLLVTFLLVDPISTLAVLGFFGLIIWLINLFVGKLMSSASLVIINNSIAFNSALGDLVNAARELTVLGKRHYYFEKIEQVRANSASAVGRQAYLAGMPRYIVETAMLLGILAFAGAKMLSGDLENSISTLAIFMTGSMRIMAAMMPWQAALIEIKRNIPQAKMAQEIIDIHLEKGESKIVGNNVRTDAPLEVVLDDVTFRYPGANSPAISNVSIRIPAGAQIAFVGASGSGKSTLGDLIMGLLEPTSGRIAVEGVSPSEVIRTQPGLLGYVPQAPGVLYGSFLENVVAGEPRENINFAKVKTAVELAHLNEVLRELPDGLDTHLGAQSDSLSGGQLQRLGLARALYSGPKLLLLDEATSALDAKSEEEIRVALDGLRGKATIILIAHRLHTVQEADIVFLISEGKVSDFGKFPDLVKRNASIRQAVEFSNVNRDL